MLFNFDHSLLVPGCKSYKSLLWQAGFSWVCFEDCFGAAILCFVGILLRGFLKTLFGCLVARATGVCDSFLRSRNLFLGMFVRDGR